MGATRRQTKKFKDRAIRSRSALQVYTEFESLRDLKQFSYHKRNQFDIFSPFDPREAAMIQTGMTYYKGMKHNEVSILSFDIETTGLDKDETSFIILISNTIRKNGKVTRKLFSYDEHDDQGEMIRKWCRWVREQDPSVICGHNIFGYDLPYISHVADMYDVDVKLGRDGSNIHYEKRESKFRKDATQFYHYHRARIYGRELIDTMFLAIKHDIGRNYVSYGLKQIIEQEGLEVKDRQFYEAWKIRHNYKDPEEYKKIKAYAIHDADDALALYDFMIPPFFYLNNSVPKTHQEMICTASGSQVNSVMVRAYLQDNHSIPEATEKKEKFEGALSNGNPGIYRNVFKLDVASLYPSIMIHTEVYDPEKDPKKYFLKLVKEFTKLRLEHKKLAKTDTYYDGLQASEKIFINSCYGFMGAPGLNFNCPQGAAYVTQVGRQILTMAMNWAKDKGFSLVNWDTDSISFCKSGFEAFSEEERVSLTKSLNDLYKTDDIRWEDDGYYETVIVIKAKNYILYDGKKIKTKGSALKATLKSPALKEFIKRITSAMLEGEDCFRDIYEEYVKEIMNLSDISRWATKKTVTDKVLNPKRTNEQKVLDAIKGKEISEGDKIYTFFKSDDSLCLVEDFNGDYNQSKMLQSLYKTAQVFDSVLPTKDYFINYSLKTKRKLLDSLLANDLNSDTLEVDRKEASNE